MSRVFDRPVDRSGDTGYLAARGRERPADNLELHKKFSEIDKNHAVLKQEMTMMQAEYMTALADLKADMANRDTEAARRDRANMQWLARILIAATILIISAVTFVIRFWHTIHAS